MNKWPALVFLPMNFREHGAEMEMVSPRKKVQSTSISEMKHLTSIRCQPAEALALPEAPPGRMHFDGRRLILVELRRGPRPVGCLVARLEDEGKGAVAPGRGLDGLGRAHRQAFSRCFASNDRRPRHVLGRRPLRCNCCETSVSWELALGERKGTQKSECQSTLLGVVVERLQVNTHHSNPIYCKFIFKQ